MPVEEKAIITNLARLQQKYGETRLVKIEHAVKALIDADALRHLGTRLIDLSSASEMAKHGGTAIAAIESTDQKKNKVAIDQVAKANKLSYIMLLGAPDVIPHQDLKNPLHSAGNPSSDPDQVVESDLPYACDAGYSNDMSRFEKVSRVVGRLPDIPNARGTQAGYLLELLDTAVKYRQRPAEDIVDVLGISAKAWEKSTQQSIRGLVAAPNGLKLSPNQGPAWTKSVLKAPFHFINCHGAAGDFRYYGDPAFPRAHDAELLDGKLSEGTVIAAECCYGAQLYDPGIHAGTMGICHTYLGRKAYAFLGSSTVSYGPREGNDCADLICQYFLRHVLAGEAVGTALALARVDYIKHASELGPHDYKTLAQFNLMGDPSLKPVAAVPSVSRVLAKGGQAHRPAALAAAAHSARWQRRATLREIARTAAAATTRVVHQAAKTRTKELPAGLRQMIKDEGMKNLSVLTFQFEAKQPRGFGLTPMAARALLPRQVHVISERLDSPAGIDLVLIKSIKAIEYEGRIEARTYQSK